MGKGLLKKKGPKQMEVKPALALPEGLELVELERSDNVLTVTVVSMQRSACCPLCGVPASRIHSSYSRQVADLPCGGQPVRLLLQVRKYFCEEPTCARKIFVDRLTRISSKVCIHTHTFMPLPGTPMQRMPSGVVGRGMRETFARLAARGQEWGNWEDHEQTAAAVAAYRSGSSSWQPVPLSEKM